MLSSVAESSDSSHDATIRLAVKHASDARVGHFHEREEHDNDSSHEHDSLGLRTIQSGGGGGATPTMDAMLKRVAGIPLPLIHPVALHQHFEQRTQRSYEVRKNKRRFSTAFHDLQPVLALGRLPGGSSLGYGGSSAKRGKLDKAQDKKNRRANKRQRAKARITPSGRPGALVTLNASKPQVDSSNGSTTADKAEKANTTDKADKADTNASGTNIATDGTHGALSETATDCTQKVAKSHLTTGAITGPAATVANPNTTLLARPHGQKPTAMATATATATGTGTSKPKSTKATKATTTPNYNMRFSFNLPLALTSEYHNRHQLSLEDFKSIFRVTEVHQLWMMALFNNFDITTSAIQSCHANIEAVTYSGNTVIVTKLLNFVAKTRQLGRRRRFICPHDEHRPRLPVHFVTETQLAALPPPSSCYDQLYHWKDIHVLPYRYYNGYLQLVRVLPRFVYHRIYGRPKNLMSCPFEFLVDGLVYCCTTESLLVQTYSNHRVLRALPENVLLNRFGDALFRSQDAQLLHSASASGAGNSMGGVSTAASDSDSSDGGL